MAVRIITDSASDITTSEKNITVMPMTVTFGEEEFLDGVTLSHQKFYELLIEGDDLPVTSQLTPIQFEDVYKEVRGANDTAVVITLSSKLSGTYQSACLAAQDYADSVVVVDSENATIGEAILVYRAAELAQQGMSCTDIAAKLDREKKDIRLVALLDTLEYLKRGGRLSGAAALVGNMLSIKPVVAVVDGEVVVLGKARGSKNGNNLLVEEIGKTNGIDFSRPHSLGYTGLNDLLLQKYINDSSALWKEHTEDLPIATIGGTIGTHVGPGGIAVAFFQKEEK